MAQTLADLRDMPEDELVRTYDQMTQGTPPSLDLFRQELDRRAYERDAVAMRDLTVQTVRLARMSTGVAILALVVALISLWH